MPERREKPVRYRHAAMPERAVGIAPARVPQEQKTIYSGRNA